MSVNNAPERHNCPICGNPCAYEKDKDIIYACCSVCESNWRRRPDPEQSNQQIYEKWEYDVKELNFQIPGIPLGAKTGPHAGSWKRIYTEKKKRKATEFHLTKKQIYAIVVIGIISITLTAFILPSSPLAPLIASNLSSGTLSPANAGQVKQLAQVESDWIHQIVWSPDGRYFAAASVNVDLYDSETLSKLHTFNSVVWAKSVAFSFDSRLIAAGGSEGLYIWNVNGYSQSLSKPNAGSIQCLTFSPDGKLLAGGVGSTIKIWDATNGDDIRTIPMDSTVNTVVFSPDGTTIAIGVSASKDDIILYDVENGQELKTLSTDTNIVKTLAFSPNGEMLASGSQDSKIMLWNPVSGQQLRVITGHTNEVTAVAFSPEGELLASASWDLTVKLWNTQNGQELNSLNGHTGWVNTVVFSPNGTRLISGAEDAAFRIWGL